MAETEPTDHAPVAEAGGAAADSAPATVQSAATGEPAKPTAAGIIAKLTGQATVIQTLEADLQTEREAHAATRAALDAANERLANFASLETALEESATALADAEARAAAAARARTEAEARAQTAAAEAEEQLPARVAEGVRDTVASLGVETEDLPTAQEQPDGPGAGGEFAHLKGRARAAAAFKAQFAGRK